MRQFCWNKLLLPAALLLSGGAAAWAVNILTEGVDVGRTGWVQGDKSFTVQNVKNMKLLWKVQLDSKPREMHNLFPPLLVENVETAAGKKNIAVVAGVLDELYGLDASTGNTIWHVTYKTDYQPPKTSATLCPGGQTAVPVVVPGEKSGDWVVWAIGWDGYLRKMNVADGKELQAPEKFIPANGKPYALNYLNGVIYTSTAQGCGGLTNSTFAYDTKTRIATAFIPSGGGLWGRRGVGLSPDGESYMGTGDGVWDVENGHLGNGIIGVKLDKSGELQLNDFYAPKNAEYMFKRDLDVNVTPVSVDWKGHKLLIGTSKECRLWLLDRDNLGGDDHRTTLAQTPLLCNLNANFAEEGVWGAISTYLDAKGDLYVVVPFFGPANPKYVGATHYAPAPKMGGGGVTTLKVTETGGKFSFTPVWTSEDIDHPDEAVIVNGVIFVNGSGEDARQQWDDNYWDKTPETLPKGPWSQQSNTRIHYSRHAVLVALDAATGKTLWSSGNQIASWNHFAGITAANGRVYIPSYDGMMYCFGVAK
ncbi:MAG: pyrrolo-quinoline quinone [Acidobacteriaceae bacterium]|nr:pyrrolo-quinoline quinone [Acidobacteriaceae bacterium]